MLKRIAIVIASVVIALPLLVSPAWACSCAPGTPRQYARWADLVFTGIADHVWTEPNDIGTPRGDERTFARFHVETRYKGYPGRWVTILPGETGNTCRVRFKEGRRYTVFAYKSKGRFNTGSCSGNQRGRINPKRYGFDDE